LSSRLRTIEDLGDVSGARVLVRCDFNVPLDAHGRITEDMRIRATLPTLLDLLGAGAALILCSHLGRPKGAPDPRFSLAAVGQRLADLLDRDVMFVDDVIGPDARAAAAPASARRGSVVLLQNLRFEPGETANDPAFADALASFADAYVDDAFGAAHRAHASVVAVPERVVRRAAGRLLEREVEVLSKLRDGPEHPFVAILGGAKISDKLGVVNALLERVDALLVGGAMAFSFLAVQGHEVGKSLVEPDRYDDVRRALATAASRGVRILLPEDIVCAPEISADAPRTTVDADAIPPDQIGLDVGPKTVQAFARALAGAKTVLWNGPMGMFELEPFADGTRGVAQAVAATDAFTVVGGGDSVAALKKLGLTGAVDHLSTGGGASLEFIEGRELPGIAVLMEED
jgi:phosphoglycerate kinase